MSLTRRNTLKLLAASCTVPCLGYWARSQAEIVKLVDNSSFSTPEQNVLVAIVDTLIPRSDHWGAVELGVPVYLVQWLDQCIDEKQQHSVKTGLNEIDKQARQTYKKHFADCEPAEREAALLKIFNLPNASEREFIELIKAQSIHGFLTTKEVMTGPYRFRIVPGHFKGCVDANAETVS